MLLLDTYIHYILYIEGTIMQHSNTSYLHRWQLIKFSFHCYWTVLKTEEGGVALFARCVLNHNRDCTFVKMVPKHNQDYSGTALPMDQKRRFVAHFRVQKHLHIK